MSEALILLVVIVVNTLISIWNCYAVGTAWNDVKAMGSGFDKLLLRSAVVQSGIGFSMPILLGLGFLANVFLTKGESPMFTPEQMKEMWEAIVNLWYILIIFPLLGSGFILWAHSIRAAMQRRDFKSIATAGWNTFAQVHNTVNAFQHVGGVFGDLGDFFENAFKSKGDAKGKLALLVIALVILALVGGFMIAISLVRHFARGHESRLEQYAREKLQAA